MADLSSNAAALVPSTYLNVILRNLEPALAGRVLQDMGLPQTGLEGLQEAVSLGQLQTAIVSLRRLIGDDWHLQVIHRLNLFAHGSLGMAAATSCNMDAAISVLERFITVRAPFVRLVRRLEQGECILQVVDETGLGQNWRDMLEIVMLGIQSLLEQVHGAPLYEAQMSFAWPAPPYRQVLEAQVQGVLVFAATEHSIVMPQSWLERSSPMHELAMHQAALSRVEAEFEAMASQITVTSRVRHALLAAPEHVPLLSEIASSQHVAPRTLIRRLKREGSSYQQVLQQVRKQRAIELLSEPTLTVKQVSYLLGYKDPSNFGRAFAQWVGQSPGAYRKGLRRK
ncbi:MAG: AraC family transcriptional regulator [Gammaproteobacteria bacterium]|jgi:AraC-like DNA-binding protein|nr:AraC family transcriptional regulator [Gammaproteobacteria bacterium]